ncbi:hypothetical protein F5Y10DRAFT_278351 [Nemania abortiva]|nr:hypothetical protein F5Y10DRAFT_278351 [Nemania abortiva]
MPNGGLSANTYSSRYPADSHLDEKDRARIRTEFLRQLSSLPYERRKNRNPKRADGTCEWFTAHPLFQNWRNETSALLWVSADPGCGKSVLARYLVDDVLPSTTTRTTCYFFFKDDFDDQKALEGALCCILHQLFTQKPVLLSDEILEDFDEGDQKYSDGEIICILDALDECVDQRPFAQALTEHYSKGKGISTLKFLVTSRPYLRIQRSFQELKESQPTIHLSEENEEEVDKIAQEITISTKQRIEELCNKLKLTIEEKQVLYAELITTHHRTYLWVHLVFAIIEETVFLTKSDMRSSIRKLPRTVEDAYESILCKSRDPEKARKILCIVVTVDRPLTTLVLRGESHRYHEELERDTPPPDRLRNAIRENCGLFVVIQDSHVFLLHQTAREFLIQLPPEYLLLADFKKKSMARRPQESDDKGNFVFLDYAASYWADHYRQAHNTRDMDLEHLALQLCNANSRTCSNWLKVYGKLRLQEPKFSRELPTLLLIASYFGLDNLVNHILQDNKTSLDIRGTLSKRTALSWAKSGAKIDALDKDGWTALMFASFEGHDTITKLLLDNGAQVNIVEKDGWTALMVASDEGYDAITKLLLDSGAQVNVSNKDGWTALMLASQGGHDATAKLLLDYGAQVDISEDGWTALMVASDHGHSTTAKLLLDHGAQIHFLSFLFAIGDPEWQL